jgi:hypothetical protein
MNGLIDFDFELAKNEDIHDIYREQRRTRENNDQRIKRL